ncbi:PucR family transcriptional regulator [Paenibacillus rigui]|nr:PucR family transcriptional regulator [Paenibacillus rigui]
MEGITIRELLYRKPNLFDKQPIIAGSSGLDRMITNINVMEVPDVYNWVRKGDLLLTTAYSIKDNPLAQEELIPKLSEAGISAIGIKTKRYLEKVPESMIRMADAYAFPILELAFEVGYSQTISEVIEEIIDRKARGLMELHRCIQLLTDSLVLGEHWSTLVETIARCMNMQAALITSRREAYSTDSSYQPVWPDIREPLASSADAIPALEGSSLGFVWPGDATKRFIPIQRNNEVLAYLICWDRANEGGTATFSLAIQHAVSLLTLQLSKQQALNHAEDNQKETFLKMWLLGELQDQQAVHLHAAVAGIQLQAQYRVGVTSRVGAQGAAKAFDKLKLQFITEGILSVALGEEWVLLIPVTGEEDDRQVEGVKKRLAGLRKLLKPYSLCMGISESQSIEHIHQGYQQACTSLELGAIVQPEETIWFYGQLGMYPLVNLLAGEDSAKRRLLNQLKPLEDHDDKHQSRLIETLIAYLKHDANIKETAQTLFCHYNSVVYRLERISSLLKADLKDPEVKFQLQLALKVYRIAQKKEAST